MQLLYRDPPLGAATPIDAPGARFTLSRRDLALSSTAGITWGCFNMSLIAVLSFGPALLVARGIDIGRAGWVVSLAVWLTFVSVPLGGYLNDRLRKPNLLIVAGSLIAALVTLVLPEIPEPAFGFALIGLVIGGPSGAIMALLPQVLRQENLATGFGVYYTLFYFSMAVGQPIAGFLRDVTGSPAAPIVFAAGIMALTAVGLAAFRRIERAWR
jgi:MFS family permease